MAGLAGAKAEQFTLGTLEINGCFGEGSEGRWDQQKSSFRPILLWCKEGAFLSAAV